MNLRPAMIHILKKRYGLKCWYCGVRLAGRNIHLDHITAKSSGGEDEIYNLALCCRACNYAKGKWKVSQFLSWIKRVRALPDFPVTDAFDVDIDEVSTLEARSINQHDS